MSLSVAEDSIQRTTSYRCLLDSATRTSRAAQAKAAVRECSTLWNKRKVSYSGSTVMGGARDRTCLRAFPRLHMINCLSRERMCSSSDGRERVWYCQERKQGGSCGKSRVVSPGGKSSSSCGRSRYVTVLCPQSLGTYLPRFYNAVTRSSLQRLLLSPGHILTIQTGKEIDSAKQ